MPVSIYIREPTAQPRRARRRPEPKPEPEPGIPAVKVPNLPIPVDVDTTVVASAPPAGELWAPGFNMFLIAEKIERRKRAGKAAAEQEAANIAHEKRVRESM